MLEDCFAYLKGGRPRKRCDALEESLCADGDCPFYKPKEQLRKEQEEARKRVARFQIEN